MKYLLVYFLLLLIAVPTQAMERPLYSKATFVGGSQRYVGLDSTAFSTTLSSAYSVIAINGTLSDLAVNVSIAPGTGETYTVTTQLNTVDTAQTCTISGTAISCTDSTHSITVVPGDLITYSITPSATADSASGYITTILTGTTAGETSLTGGSTTFENAEVPKYYPLGWGDPKDVESSVSTVFPASGVLDHFYVQMNSGPGSGGDTFTYSVLVNGSSTSMTCSISNGDRTCNDVTNSIAINPGDTVSISQVRTVTPTSRTAHWGIRFTPTTDGENPYFGYVDSGIVETSTQYGFLHGFDISFSESTAQFTAPLPFTWKNAYASISDAPGTGKNWVLTNRINGADGALDVTIADSATTGNDTTHTNSVAAGDLVDWSIVPSGTPTTLTKFAWSAVADMNTGGDEEPPAVATPLVELVQALWIN